MKTSDTLLSDPYQASVHQSLSKDMKSISDCEKLENYVRTLKNDLDQFKHDILDPYEFKK